jgi:hypothetical protein
LPREPDVPDADEDTFPLLHVAVTEEAWTRPSNAENPEMRAEAFPPPAETEAELMEIVPSDERALPDPVWVLPLVLDTDGLAEIGAAPLAEIPYAASW